MFTLNDAPPTSPGLLLFQAFNDDFNQRINDAQGKVKQKTDLINIHMIQLHATIMVTLK